MFADLFLNFWYKFALPNWSRPEFLEDMDSAAQFVHKFDVFLGDAWERLVRSRLSKDYRGVARWWGTGLNRQKMEIDIVGESFDGRTLSVGEAKISAGERDVERIKHDLAQKAEALPFRGKYDSIRTEVFVADEDDVGV